MENTTHLHFSDVPGKLNFISSDHVESGWSNFSEIMLEKSNFSATLCLGNPKFKTGGLSPTLHLLNEIEASGARFVLRTSKSIFVKLENQNFANNISSKQLEKWLSISNYFN